MNAQDSDGVTIDPGTGLITPTNGHLQVVTLKVWPATPNTLAGFNETNGLVSFQLAVGLTNVGGLVHLNLIPGTGINTSTNEDGGVVINAAAGEGGGGETNTASNLGNGYRLFQDKNGVDLRFNTLTNGPQITITSNANTFLFDVVNLMNSNIAAGANIERNKLASGTLNHVLINNGSGEMSSEAQLALSRGGSGQATAAAAFDAFSQSAEVSIASGATVNLGAAASQQVLVTGTATISGFGTVAAGTKRLVRFDGAGELTHNATSLILPNNGGNITRAAGDRMLVVSEGGGNWRVWIYQRANGQALIDNTGGGGGLVGTMLNSGTPVAGALPGYADVTGTNMAPSRVTVVDTNLFAGNVTATNEVAAASFRTTGSPANAAVRLPDDDESHSARMEAAGSMTTNINLQLPVAPWPGVLIATVAEGTNWGLAATNLAGIEANLEVDIVTSDEVQPPLAGTVINSGASIVGALSTHSDTTGTNVVPVSVTAITTNLMTGGLAVTNASVTVGGNAHTFPATASTVARTDAGQTFLGTQNIGTIDVGNADTTIERAAGGVISVEGVPVPTRTSVHTWENKTYDAAGTGNVFRKKDYLWLRGADSADSTGRIPNTNDFTQFTFMKPVFANGADQAANFVRWDLQIPDDWDTAVDPRLKITFRLTGADTGTQRYVASIVSVANSATYDGTPANAVNLDFAGDGAGASGDVEQVGYVTLTGWGAAVTPGRHAVLVIARDGDAAEDGSTVDSMFSLAALEYGSTQ